MATTYPNNISISDYDYPLPDDRIARYPLAARDQSKLLIYRANDASISEEQFFNLPALLPPKSLLVRNQSRVIRARLLFKKDSGAQIEVFCLEPEYPRAYEQALAAMGTCSWHCMLGNARRWRNSPLSLNLINITGENIELIAKRDSTNPNIVQFTWSDHSYSFAQILELAGQLPIPPYLNRATEQSDLKTYQTVYARESGSVAAPTAGLHFSETVQNDLHLKGIKCLDLTLHVGAGTFLPVKKDLISLHEMHHEWVLIERETIEYLAQSEEKVIAVGTTSVRSLESLFHIGVMLHNNPETKVEELNLAQWEAYENGSNDLTKEMSLKTILGWMERNDLERLEFSTHIMIVPGYRFRMVEGIVTNFHQPRSTLLLLVSAFIGEDWRKVYRYALENSFRFLSYGDSSLLLPNSL